MVDAEIVYEECTRASRREEGPRAGKLDAAGLGAGRVEGSEDVGVLEQ